MSDKPSVSTAWATDENALKIVPDTGQQEFGWNTSDGTINGNAPIPAMQNQNGWQNNVHQWLEYVASFRNTDDWYLEFSWSNAYVQAPMALVNVANNTLNIGDTSGYRTGLLCNTSNFPSQIPDGLSTSGMFMIVVDSENISFAASAKDAFDGVAIDITTQGTADSYWQPTVWYMPPDLPYDVYKISGGTVVLPDIGSLPEGNTTKVFTFINTRFGPTSTFTPDYTGTGSIDFIDGLDDAYSETIVSVKANPEIAFYQQEFSCRNWNIWGPRDWATDPRKKVSFSISGPVNNTVTVEPDDINIDSNTITLGTTLYSGRHVKFTATTGTLPGGIVLNQDYYITVLNGRGCFRLSTSESFLNAGNYVDITDQGSGEQTLELQPYMFIPNAAPYRDIEIGVNTSGNIDFTLKLPGTIPEDPIRVTRAFSTNPSNNYGSKIIIEAEDDINEIDNNTIELIGFGSSTELRKDDSGNWYCDYEEWRAILAGHGTDNLFGDIFLSRTKMTYFLTWTFLNHNAVSTLNTDTGLLPEKFRPQNQIFNCFITDSQTLRTFELNPDGTLYWVCRNYSGGGAATSSTYAGSASYVAPVF